MFGVKGGAAGGGYAQVVPMDEINLHFTGDFHAVTSAHNLLSAMLDNHLHHGNALGLDTRRITWPRTIDMNDRALRQIVVGLGGMNGGPTREERFVIVPGSEIMAILCLASDLQRPGAADLRGSSSGSPASAKPVTAGDLKAAGAMTLLLKDAILPNLVQTLEGGPALVHGGPFGNIAHGCNSIVATKLGLRPGGYRAHRGRFRRRPGRREVLRHQVPLRRAQAPRPPWWWRRCARSRCTAGVKKENLGTPDVAALERGLANLEGHVKNVQKFGVPVVVALNRFLSDTQEEQQAVLEAARGLGRPRGACATSGPGAVRAGRRSARRCWRCWPRARPTSSRCTTPRSRSSRRSRPSPPGSMARTA